MRVVKKQTIEHYIKDYPKAEYALRVWYNEMRKQSFSNFNQLKSVHGSASILPNKRVVFNIKANDYRLIVKINFYAKAIYTIWFGTHAEYDLVDAPTIKYHE